MLYFARSAELAGLRCETLSVPRQITSLQLWEEIVKVHPRYSGQLLLRCRKFNVVGVFLVNTNSEFSVELEHLSVLRYHKNSDSSLFLLPAARVL